MKVIFDLHTGKNALYFKLRLSFDPLGVFDPMICAVPNKDVALVLDAIAEQKMIRITGPVCTDNFSGFWKKHFKDTVYIDAESVEPVSEDESDICDIAVKACGVFEGPPANRRDKRGRSGTEFWFNTAEEHAACRQNYFLCRAYGDVEKEVDDVYRYSGIRIFELEGVIETGGEKDDKGRQVVVITSIRPAEEETCEATE